MCSVPLFVCTPAPRPAVCPEPLGLISFLFSYCFTEFSSPGFHCAFSPPALRSLIRGVQVLGTISRQGSFCLCILLFSVCGSFVVTLVLWCPPSHAENQHHCRWPIRWSWCFIWFCVFTAKRWSIKWGLLLFFNLLLFRTVLGNVASEKGAKKDFGKSV